MITGVHVTTFTKDADALRGLLDALGLESVDAGGGWLIFALPPAEMAAHPSEEESAHKLYFMCDDINATIEELKGKGIEFAGDVSDEGYGLLASIDLPGGDQIGLYEPRHPTAIAQGDRPG